MYLTEIAADIVEAINASSPESWPGGLVLPSDLRVTDALDPFNNEESAEPGVYVIPSSNEFDLSNSRGSRSGQILGIARIRRIIIAVCVPLKSKLRTSQSFDIASKTEWSVLSNLREDLENFVLTMSLPGIKLVDIESAPPDEAALDARLFLAATVFGFAAC